jgi:acyl-CoA synthetase (AMP-forming)/AMP-acid ligase II
MDQADVIRRSSHLFADNLVVSCDGRELTYRDMYDRACRLAHALRARGIAPGDRVAVLSPNSFELIEQTAACALANLPRATLYTYHSHDVNRYLLDQIAATALLVHSSVYAGLAPYIDDWATGRTVLVFGPEAPEGALSYEEALARATAEDMVVPCAPDDPFIIRFSSGTTGKPKAIYHTRRSWSEVTNEWRWATPMVTERSRYLCPIMLAHLGVALVWDMLTVGGAIVAMGTFDAERALELIEEHRATHIAAAPVMIRDMLDVQDTHPRDLSSLECVLYAGSPIAEPTMRRAIATFGPILCQLYAQSEALPATMLLPHQHVLDGTEAEQRRLRSVGRPTPRVVVTVRDDDGAEVPVGEIGEIAVWSGFVMSGIWGDPEGTANRLLPDGSVLTRDMGYVDDDGFVYLVDRKDDMIVSGGYNIWPTELEQALLNHPAVVDAVVFGVPDDRWGETPKAAVVLAPDVQATEDELIAHTRAIVGGVKKITSVDFHDSLPRTSTGKLQRGALKDPYWAGKESRIAGS